jgi:hypothetical protein
MSKNDIPACEICGCLGSGNYCPRNKERENCFLDRAGICLCCNEEGLKCKDCQRRPKMSELDEILQQLVIDLPHCEHIEIAKTEIKKLFLDREKLIKIIEKARWTTIVQPVNRNKITLDCVDMAKSIADAIISAGEEIL